MGPAVLTAGLDTNMLQKLWEIRHIILKNVIKVIPGKEKTAHL